MMRRRRGFIGLGMGTRARPPVMPAIYRDLIAYYRMEGGGADATGRGNDLAEQNGASYAAGKVGSGLSLVGASSQYLARNNVTDLGNLTSFWVSAWVNPGVLGINNSIVYTVKADGSSAASILTGINSLGAAFNQVRRSDGTLVLCESPTGTSPVGDGNWHLTDFALDGSTRTLYTYVDTVLLKTADLGGSIWQEASPKLYLGMNRALNEPWDGLLDEVGIWRRVPTAADLAARYAGGAGRSLYP